MSSKYRNVRLSRAVYARLAAYRDKLHALYVVGLVSLPDDQAEHVSLDYAVATLLDAKEDHRERAKRQRSGERARRSAKRRTVEQA